MEGVSEENNEIYVELTTENLSRALKTAQNARTLKVKLTNKLFPCLTVCIELVSRRRPDCPLQWAPGRLYPTGEGDWFHCRERPAWKRVFPLESASAHDLQHKIHVRWVSMYALRTPLRFRILALLLSFSSSALFPSVWT